MSYTVHYQMNAEFRQPSVSICGGGVRCAVAGCCRRPACRVRRADETVFELMVPTDDPKFLQDALRIFSQFATSIRCSEADLAKERGAVLDVRPKP